MKSNITTDYHTQWKKLEARLEKGTFLSTPFNNKLALLFLKAKENGGYERIVYNHRCIFQTLIKNARNLARVDGFFKKDFDKINEKELLKYRDLLNDDKVYSYRTRISWVEKKIKGKVKKLPIHKVEKTDKPISYRTKVDIQVTFIKFNEFMREYFYQEKKEELKDITSFFTVRRPTDFKEVTVNYIPDDELHTFLDNIHNRELKSLIQLSLMSGARKCEALSIRYGKSYNLYKNQEGKWIIHLPKIKKISYTKFPFIVDMYEEELCPFFENLCKRDGELVFSITDKTYSRLMNYYSEKHLGKKYTPTVLRKTARMIRTNAGYSHDWINKLMGHAPGSKVQGHYTNYEGIKNEPEANEKLKAQQYPSIKKDYENLKLKIKAIEERHTSEIQEMFKKVKEELTRDFIASGEAQKLIMKVKGKA
jgi:hypothetical protein